MEFMNVLTVPKLILSQRKLRNVWEINYVFVFHNFPVTKIRPHAYETALAAEAAAAQGKFWEMYDYLFKHGQWVTNDSLRQSAAKLGINLTIFDSEFRDRRYSSHIDEDIQ